MATAAALDQVVAGGVKGLRERIKKLQEAIARENEKAEALEKERDALDQILARVVGKQETLKARIEDTMVDLDKSNKKADEMEWRALEKERFVRDSNELNERMKIVALDEALVAEKESELAKSTELYQENFQRTKSARAAKSDLEKRFDEIEGATMENEWRLKSLKTELEYNLIEEERRSVVCKRAEDAAFQVKNACTDLERGLDGIMNRQDIALRKLNDLESRLCKTEDTLEATNFERRKLEATIRDILLNARDMYKDEEEEEQNN